MTQRREYYNKKSDNAAVAVVDGEEFSYGACYSRKGSAMIFLDQKRIYICNEGMKKIRVI